MAWVQRSIALNEFRCLSAFLNDKTLLLLWKYAFGAALAEQPTAGSHMRISFPASRSSHAGRRSLLQAPTD